MNVTSSDRMVTLTTGGNPELKETFTVNIEFDENEQYDKLWVYGSDEHNRTRMALPRTAQECPSTVHLPDNHGESMRMTIGVSRSEMAEQEVKEFEGEVVVKGVINGEEVARGSCTVRLEG